MRKDFGELERESALFLLDRALREEGRDITSEAIIPPSAQGRAILVARRRCVAAGIPVAQIIADYFKISFDPTVEEGQELKAGESLGLIEGNLRSILKSERILLNFLGRLSGIATLTRRYVEAFNPLAVYDTRKTTPGWRALEKYAVRVGGGQNHRMGLEDQVLIKDNHLEALKGLKNLGQLNETSREKGREISRAEAVREAIQKARTFLVEQVSLGTLSPGTAIEVEVESEEEFLAAVEAGADIIMLDNWEPERIQNFLKSLSPHQKKAPLLELSGNIQTDLAQELSKLPAHRVAVGAITHSAPAADFSLELKGAWIDEPPP